MSIKDNISVNEETVTIVDKDNGPIFCGDINSLAKEYLRLFKEYKDFKQVVWEIGNKFK